MDTKFFDRIEDLPMPVPFEEAEVAVSKIISDLQKYYEYSWWTSRIVNDSHMFSPPEPHPVTKRLSLKPSFKARLTLAPYSYENDGHTQCVGVKIRAWWCWDFTDHVTDFWFIDNGHANDCLTYSAEVNYRKRDMKISWRSSDIHVYGLKNEYCQNDTHSTALSLNSIGYSTLASAIESVQERIKAQGIFEKILEGNL